MDYCRSVLAVAGANFRRLKRDARVWFIFVFTALLIHYYLRPSINSIIDHRTQIIMKQKCCEHKNKPHSGITL